MPKKRGTFFFLYGILTNYSCDGYTMSIQNVVTTGLLTSIARQERRGTCLCINLGFAKLDTKLGFVRALTSVRSSRQKAKNNAQSLQNFVL